MSMESLWSKVAWLFGAEEPASKAWKETSDRLLHSFKRMEERGMTQPEATNLARVVGNARKRAGLTFEDMAAKAGLSPEDAIDLVYGTIPLKDAAKYTKRAMPVLNISEESYKDALATDTRSKSS